MKINFLFGLISQAKQQWWFFRKCVFIFCAIIVFSLFFSQPSYSMDKRLKVLLKTSGYGAAAGTLVGTGLWVTRLAPFKGVFIGASVGLYTGIALATYAILVPASKPDRYRYLQKPRRPVGANDWQSDPQVEDYYEMLPPDEGAYIERDLGNDYAGIIRDRGAMVMNSQPVFWTPVLVTTF